MKNLFTLGGDFDRTEKLYNELVASEEEDAEKEEQEEEARKKQNQASIQDFYSNDRISPTSGFESEILSEFEEEQAPTIIEQEEEKPPTIIEGEAKKPTEEKAVEMPTKPPVLGSLEEYEARVKSGEGNIAPTEEELAGSTKLGREFQEEEFAKAKTEWEQADIARSQDIRDKEAKKQALNERLNAKLAEVEKSFEIANTKYDIDNKFREIQSNSRNSLDSIDNEIMKLSFNKEVAGTAWGKMKIQELMVEKDLVKQQVKADSEKLGVYAWESMSPDNKLVFGRLMQNETVDPQSRLQYVANNDYITKAVNGLEAEMKLIGIPDNLIEESKDKLLGKKLLVNGQVQYDQDNQPVRQDGGLVRKNKLGVYEPTVDMSSFKNGYDSIAKSFSPAKAEGAGGAGGELDPTKAIKDAKSALDAYNTNREALFLDYKGGKELKDFLPEDAYAEGRIDKTELNRINEIKEAAKDLLKKGVVLEEEERAKGKAISSKTELDTQLKQLVEAPEDDQLINLGRNGKVRSFRVENNKLVELSPDSPSEITTDDYVVVFDELGANLVPTGGREKLQEFRDVAKKNFYYNGKFTTEAPSILKNETIRTAALGLAPVISIPVARAVRKAADPTPLDTEFNKYLEQARKRKEDLRETKEGQAKTTSVWDELKA